MTLLLVFPLGVGAARDPQDLPGGVCRVETKRPLLPTPLPGARDISQRSHAPEYAGSVLPDCILKVSPALEDQGRFQPPLKVRDFISPTFLRIFLPAS